jgi:uncharacterized protein YbjT (DUF2867 family)
MKTSAAAFVAGATGLTGRHVVRILRERDVSTIAHVRPDSRQLQSYKARFEELGAEVDTTPWELEAMAATFSERRPTIVFALLGTTRARAKRARRAGGDASKENYEAVDYELTKILLHASLGIEPHPLFQYLSSVGVAEGTRNPYLAVRARLEKEMRESGIPHVITRPSFIVGDRDPPRPLDDFAAKVGDGALAALGLLGGRRLRDRYRSTKADTLAQALVNLALDPSAVGRIVETGELHDRAGD